MFQEKTVTHTNPLLNYIQLKSPEVSCKVFPNLGASIQELQINTIPIIEGIQLNEDGLLSYDNAYQSALLFPFAGRVEKGQFTFLNKNYRLESNEYQKENAIHGLIFNKTFKTEFCDLSHSKVVIHLSFLSDGMLKGFPFKFKFNVVYELTNNELIIGFNVINLDDKPFPFSCGWHPYFKSSNLDSCSLSFKAHEQLSCDSNMIPKTRKISSLPPTFSLNNMSFDNTFLLLDDPVIFKTEHYNLQMKCSSNYLQLYTPYHRQSIAIEPITAEPNAFNSGNGLSILNPTEHFNWQINLKIDTHV